MCHEPTRRHIIGVEGFPLPSLEEAIALNVTLAARTNPAVRCAGVSLNTSALDEAAAAEALTQATRETGLPAADPIRGGETFTRLVDACLA